MPFGMDGALFWLGRGRKFSSYDPVLWRNIPKDDMHTFCFGSGLFDKCPGKPLRQLFFLCFGSPWEHFYMYGRHKCFLDSMCWRGLYNDDVIGRRAFRYWLFRAGTRFPSPRRPNI